MAEPPITKALASGGKNCPEEQHPDQAGRPMTRRDLIGLCLTFPGAYEDYPFDDTAGVGVWTVMRHRGNRKSFALIFERMGRLCVNLKCDPMRADFWRGVYRDCQPGWHMNKVHWNTVYLDGDVPQEELTGMIRDSFELTRPKR